MSNQLSELAENVGMEPEDFIQQSFVNVVSIAAMQIPEDMQEMSVIIGSDMGDWEIVIKKPVSE